VSPAEVATGPGPLAVALLLAGSYLAGSIPFGLLIVRLASGADVRTIGSGNIGATNVARAAGRWAAIATLVLDALKGLAAVLGAGSVPGGSAWLPGAAGVCAVVGHCFPVWLRFRGGKGVATGLGVALGLSPLAAGAGGVAWILLFKLFRVSSIGSLAGVAVALTVAGLTAGRVAVGSLAAVGLLILIRHADNLRRLFGRIEGKL
jgi:glycerol-3-phosphate acyltransferase PlsY